MITRLKQSKTMLNKQMIQMICLLAFATVALLLTGCPQQTETTDVDVAVSDTPVVKTADGNETGLRFSNDPVYPIPLADRPYQDVHESVHQAWFLIETGYFVIKDKYLEAGRMLSSKDEATKQKGSLMRQEITQEIEHNIFQVNDRIEALFQEAIDAEPDNPLNYASYSIYLKPRRRPVEDDKFIDTEAEALEMMDRAIELWPDEASFYMLKVNILADSHKCHDWLRSQMAQQIAINKRLEMIEDLLDKAEQYYPDNHYINYRKALLMVRYTPPEEIPGIMDKLIGELRKGNAKPSGYFNYPPPLEPFPHDVQKVRLTGSETEAKYVDQWMLYGHYDTQAISLLVDVLVQNLNWPEDKEDIGELMYFLYQIGRTKPYDRSMFSLQLKVLNPMLERQADSGSEEAKKLAEALRFLTSQYQEVANSLYTRKLIVDSWKLDVRGINDVEVGGSHMKNVREIIQGPQAAYLQRAGEILGIDFPLPENPRLW